MTSSLTVTLQDPSSGTEPWDPRGVCLCGQEYFAHDLVSPHSGSIAPVTAPPSTIPSAANSTSTAPRQHTTTVPSSASSQIQPRVVPTQASSQSMSAPVITHSSSVVQPWRLPNTVTGPSMEGSNLAGLSTLGGSEVGGPHASAHQSRHDIVQGANVGVRVQPWAPQVGIQGSNPIASVAPPSWALPSRRGVSSFPLPSNTVMRGTSSTAASHNHRSHGAYHSAVLSASTSRVSRSNASQSVFLIIVIDPENVR